MNRTWAFWLAAAAVGGLVARPAFGIYEDVTTERYPDADAVLVDTTEMDLEASVQYVISLIRERLGL